MAHSHYGAFNTDNELDEFDDQLTNLRDIDELATTEAQSIETHELTNRGRRRVGVGVLVGAMCTAGVMAVRQHGSTTNLLLSSVPPVQSIQSIRAEELRTHADADAESADNLGWHHHEDTLWWQDKLTFSASRDEYDPIPAHTLGMYGKWDMIVEPNCEMVFTVEPPEGLDATYTWEFFVPPTEDYNQSTNRPTTAGFAVDTIIDEGMEGRAKFHGVNFYFRISLTATLNDGSNVSSTSTIDTITKFVRREIHSIVPHHRERYFEALEIVYNTSQEDGEALYGQHFLNHGHLAALHNSELYGYHGQLAFLTSHPAFQLKLEKSLASVHADVVYPYWDFLVDASLGTNWTQADVYKESWFGTVDNGPERDYRPKGRFSSVKLVMDRDEKAFPDTCHNPYGFVGDEANANPSRYMQRTNEVCGFGATQGLQGCDKVSHCFGNYTTLHEWDYCMEKKVHANLHSMNGGLFNCQTDWVAWMEANSWAGDARMSYFANMIVSNAPGVTRAFSVSCPKQCYIGIDSYDTCRCMPDDYSSVDDLDDLTAIEVAVLMQPWMYGNYEAKIGDHTDLYITLVDDLDSEYNGFYMPGGDVTEDQGYALNLLLLKTAMFAGTSGPMEGGAAPNDPIFWVMHQVFDKALQALRLSPNYNKGNLTWDNSATMEGESWDGGATPFTAELFETMLGSGISADTSLTNKQLWSLLKPDGTDLPYVYEQFTVWGECHFDPMEGVHGSPTAAPTPDSDSSTHGGHKHTHHGHTNSPSASPAVVGAKESGKEAKETKEAKKAKEAKEATAPSASPGEVVQAAITEASKSGGRKSPTMIAGAR